MIIHPPLLYMGYVGFRWPSRSRIVALLGQLDAAPGHAGRGRGRWRLGLPHRRHRGRLGMGLLRTRLGGWWFWDPVENASFMPWLLGTALIHSLAVTEKRGAFKTGRCCWRSAPSRCRCSAPSWCARASSPACMPSPPTPGAASSSCPARDRDRLLAAAVRDACQQAHGRRQLRLVSRETALLANNVLLTVVSASVLLGTPVSALPRRLGLGKISVGPPYFEAVFVPLMTPVVVLMMFGPFCAGRTTPWSPRCAASRRLSLIASVAIGVGGACGRWITSPGAPRWACRCGLGGARQPATARRRLGERRGLGGLCACVRSPRRGGDVWLATSASASSSSASPWWAAWTATSTSKMKEGTPSSPATFRLPWRGGCRRPQLRRRARGSRLRDGRSLDMLTPEKRVYLGRKCR